MLFFLIDLDKMERIFSGGICLNAFFLTNMSQSIGNFNMLVDLAKKAQRFEPVYAFIRICSSYDDQVSFIPSPYNVCRLYFYCY